MNTHPVSAGVGTFYAHKEASTYSSTTNNMDQAPPEPNVDETYISAASTGTFQLKTSLNNPAQFYTYPWPSAETIPAGDWTFHTWLYANSSNVVATYYVKVFKNQDATPIFTTGTASVPQNTYSEVDITYSAPSISMAANDRLRFEYYVSITTAQNGKRIYWKIDHDTSVGTRVDTTITQLVPTLGWPLLFLAIAFFVGMLLKKGVLRVGVA